MTKTQALKQLAADPTLAGRPVSDLARRWDVSRTTVRRWVNSAVQVDAPVEPPAPQQVPATVDIPQCHVVPPALEPRTSWTTAGLNIMATATAVGLVAFSGSISAWGLSKFTPGAEAAIVVMAVLFESAKLVGFAMVHKPAPIPLKGALLVTGLILMTLNVVGVAGFLSNAYESRTIGTKAATHTAESAAHAEASLLERQLVHAEEAVSQARTAIMRARDDKGRVKAAQVILTASTADREALVRQLSTAQASTAQVEGATIAAGGEFAAVQFLAAFFSVDPDTVAHLLILVISALPDVLAALLIITIGYVPCYRKESRA
jgi:hypothetical protein